MTDTDNKGAAMPLAVWPCAQTRRHSDSRGAAAEIARRAIQTYSRPGDLVLDLLCENGATVIEATLQKRNALAVVDGDARQITRIREQVARALAGTPGHAAVLHDAPTELPRLLAEEGRPFLASVRQAGGTVRRHPCGSVDLILATAANRAGRQPLAVRGDRLAGVCRGAAARRLPRRHRRRPGPSRPRRRSHENGPALGTSRAPVLEHVIALLIPIRDSQLQPSQAGTREGRRHVHADVLVIRKPAAAVEQRTQTPGRSMSTATIHPSPASCERIAAKAGRNLEVVASFAAAGIDPHAAARAKAARAR